LAILITLKSYSCTSKDGFSKEKETRAIVALLQQERKAHFDRNAELFMSGFADSMLSVNRGKVSVASPDENRKRINAYFGSVQFIKWDDVTAPIIRFSDDGSLAYAVVQKQVILSRQGSPGKWVIDTTIMPGRPSIEKKKRVGR